LANLEDDKFQLDVMDRFSRLDVVTSNGLGVAFDALITGVGVKRVLTVR
jgi:hypothetical protein